MRVALFSSRTFGLRSLTDGVMVVPNVDIVGILTTQSRIDVSYASRPIEIGSHAEFGDVAKSCGCEVVQLAKPPKTFDYLACLDQWKPAVILVLEWYYNIPLDVRQRADLGYLGIHASLLPKYRGDTPKAWAIINGESRTGVSLFHLTDEIDAGDIVAQEAFAIDADDSVATVYRKAEEATVGIPVAQLPRLAVGTASRAPQDHEQATLFPQRSPEDDENDPPRWPKAYKPWSKWRSIPGETDASIEAGAADALAQSVALCRDTWNERPLRIK